MTGQQESIMQTIRIYRIIDNRPGHTRLCLVHEVTGPANKLESSELHSRYPADLYMWLR